MQVILLLIKITLPLSIIFEISCQPVPINHQLSIYNHFSTYYAKFYSSIQTGSIHFNNHSTLYTFQRPLPYFQANISSCHSVLSSFQSDVNKYFGYRIISYCDNNTPTNIHFQFNVEQFSSFKMIGFDVIVISTTFNNVFQTYYFNFGFLTNGNLIVCENISKPTYFNLFSYVVDYKSQSTADIYSNVNFDSFSPTTLCLRLSVNSNTKVWFTKMLVIIVNEDNVATDTRFHQKLYYNNYPIINNIFSSIDFNINKIIYGDHFSRKCILGFSSMNNLNYVTAYFKFDIDQLNGQIINKFQNSFGNFLDFLSLCFNTICNTGFTYRHQIDQCVFDGCIEVALYLNQYICLKCDVNRGLMLFNTICVCKTGYVYNNLNGICQEKCGDGLTILQNECDDANDNNNDGCTNQCKIMDGFVCDVTYNKTTCKYPIHLQLQIFKIQKISNGQAKLYINATNTYFPFQFIFTHFISSDPLFSMISIYLINSENEINNLQLNSQLIFVSGRQLQIFFNYDSDIQGFPAFIILNTSKTNYICENNQSKHYFYMIGSNQALKFYAYESYYDGIEITMFVNTIITNFILFIGLLSKKYIGLECMLTLQLIYYSQLLATPWNKFPVEFQSLKYLKYVNGYNLFNQNTQFIPKSSIQKKLTYLSISKQIIQNYNLNFIFLIIPFSVLLISISLKNLKNQKEDQIIIIKAHQSQEDKFKNNKKKQNKSNLNGKKYQKQDNLQEIFSLPQKQLLTTLNAVIQFSYRSVSQISKWILLQIICSFSSFLFISNKHYTPSINIGLIKLGFFSFFVSFLIVLSISLNNIKNLYLDQKIFNKQNKILEQLRYKQLNFAYLLIIGFMIFFLNQSSPFLSLFVLIYHFCYLILINFKVRPYKNALKIHSFSLFLHHFNYLVFLIFINLINFVDNLHHLIKLTMSFCVTLICSISIILTLIRLYYEYRYGQLLQRQLKKQEQLQKIQKQKANKQKQQTKIDILKAKAKKRQIIQQKQTKNIYSIEHEIQQQNKQEYLTFLQNRNFITKQKQQTNYYQKYHQKPLKWLQKYDKEEYQKIINHRKKLLKKNIEKKQLDPEFVLLKKKMMKEADALKNIQKQDM